ncbi:MAG TPA: FGGY family carbohydrate kinase, partial [Gammaproteobacteria bacterium]|nr:FGGY family carbohydrate kinase [Gammaproteobacteria bacterium]
MSSRPTEPYFLALDQGGHSSCFLVFSATGEVIAQAQKPVATQASHPNWVEHDAQVLVDSLRSVIADVHATSGRDAKHVRSVGGWPRSVPIASAG